MRQSRIGLARTDAKSLKLTDLQRIIVGHCAAEPKVAALFGPTGVATRVAAECGPLAESLRDEQLLVSEERQQAVRHAALPGLILLPLVAGAKLLMALAKGRHNVGFLIALLIVGMLVMVLLSRAPRVTARGRKYLERIRDAFAGLKDNTGRRTTIANDPALLLIPAVFGVGMLAGTEYGYVTTLFRKASSSSSGSCGGCGTGCGAGCGGGGCGGGGGGGCGGGCGGCGG